MIDTKLMKGNWLDFSSRDYSAINKYVYAGVSMCVYVCVGECILMGCGVHFAVLCPSERQRVNENLCTKFN